MKEIQEKLKKRNINTYIVKDKQEALSKVDELILPGDTIGFGGSITLEQIGIFDNIKKANLLSKKDEDFYYKCLSSDVFLSSANAISKEGKIINVDGRSNRVAAISFGPKKVIIVAGKNKIVEDDQKGLERIKNVCIPKNLDRLKKLGKEGWTADNMWCNISIIERQKDPQRMHVILVDEELGY